MPRDPTAFDSLATPVAWLDGSLRLMGANPAFGRWLGVGLRRLPGVPLDALEADGDVLHRLVARPPADDGAVRLQRLPVAFPGQGAVRFADITLSPSSPARTRPRPFPVRCRRRCAGSRTSCATRWPD